MKNKLIFACAGSGKTTSIIQSSLEEKHSKKILITTFTDQNCDEILKKFYEINGYVPDWVDVVPFFTFELRHLIKPYQSKFKEFEIRNTNLVHGYSAKYTSKSDKNYYFDSDNRIYSDKISLLAYEIIKEDSRVIKRLEAIYDIIYIDEFQDLTGYDLFLIKFLMESNISIYLYGDPRQKTYSTHPDKKFAKYEADPSKYIKEFCGEICEIDTTSLNYTFRCPEIIISTASKIFPQFPVSHSKVPYTVGDGIYLVEEKYIDEFIRRENNVIQLRNSSKEKRIKNGVSVMTFGKSKGTTLENVLLFPTKDMKDAILNSNYSLVKADGSKCKLYVAMTRAKHKLGIVVTENDLKRAADKTLMIYNN